MGEMILRGIEEATLNKLRQAAEQRGLEPETYAIELLDAALRPRDPRPLDVARRILAMQKDVSPVSSVELLREIRNEMQ